jgi:hypothetical protein
MDWLKATFVLTAWALAIRILLPVILGIMKFGAQGDADYQTNYEEEK